MLLEKNFSPLYFFKYKKEILLKNGTVIHIRSIHAEDEPALRSFFNTLSEESIFFRFGSFRINMDHEYLARLCQVDYERDISILAVVPGEKDVIIGDARINRLSDFNRAELSFIIADQWQGMGIGNLLMDFCIMLSRKMGLTSVLMEVIKSNVRMKHLGCKYGFKQLVCKREDDMVELELKIGSQENSSIPFGGEHFLRNTLINSWGAVVQ